MEQSKKKTRSQMQKRAAMNQQKAQMQKRLPGRAEHIPEKIRW